MSYKNKYLKYKLKYLAAKKQYTGGAEKNIINYKNQDTNDINEGNRKILPFSTFEFGIAALTETVTISPMLA